MPTNFDKHFDRHFAQFEKRAKRLSVLTIIFVFLQLAFWLCVAGGIVYFIVYAITHWLKW